MSSNGNRLAESVASYPRLTGALLTSLTLLTLGVSSAMAGSGAIVGP